MLTLLQPTFVHSRTRRKGQALILAVFVMLFAVLLSSAFLVVIGNNGRQVGRETDKLEASRNADKGVAFVVARLRATNSPDSWNAAADYSLVGQPLTPVDPGSSGGVPGPTDANYNLYYSQLDQAMGWASQGYVKYPDPRSSRQAPQFLVSSHLLGTSANDDADGGDKRFMLRITVIGLSSKNPEAWSRRTLYKATNWNRGTFSYANFVTSFDPDTQKSITSTLANSTTVTVPANPALNSIATIPVYAFKGQGNDRVTYSARVAEVGSTLMVSDGQNQPLVGIVKGATLTNNVYSIALRVLQAGTTAGNFGINAKVALVGSLFEVPQQIDADGSTTNLQNTQNQNIFGVRADPTPAAAQPFGNGALFNNGLNVPITTNFAARPPAAPTTGSSTIAGQNSLSSTGPVSIGDPSPTTVAPAINLVNATVPTPVPIPIAQPNPLQNQFLQVAFDKAGAAQVATANSVVAPVIAPRTLRPATIDFASYVNKARATNTYISNAEDVEKFNGRELTTSQLQRLWQRKSFVSTNGGGNVAAFPSTIPATAPTTPIQTGTEAVRLCYGRAGVDTYQFPLAAGGLEAQGIRGWISPWEFLPRGVQIILNGTTMTIIQDPLSDSSTNAPDLSKSFNPATREFAQRNIAPPAGGIIVADGNIRIRGNWTGDPLTIVSGNNIYIEGNLSTRNAGVLLPGKLALLAKKNVVLNPTQFVSRPDGTVDTSVGRTAVTGTVNTGAATFDTSKFKLGDKVAVFIQGQPADGWRTVTAITPTTLTFNPALNLASVPDNTKIKVKLACDPPLVLLKDNPESTTDYFQGHLTAGTANDARTQEFDPVTNPANAGTSWAYKFSVGGDTLARQAPFGGTIGVAVSQAAEKKNTSFTVKGGEDAGATPAITDNGERKLITKDAANPYQLLIRPQPGTATDPAQDKTFDLQAVTSGSPGDTNSTLTTLRTQIVNTPDDDTDQTKNRWHLVLPTPVPPATTGDLDSVPARRLAQTAVTLTIPNADLATEETTPTTIRVPLTSSVLLFGNDLGAVDPATQNPLLNIGSIFGYQAAAFTTAEDPTTVNSDFYGTMPKWSIPADATPDSKVVYALVEDTTVGGANGFFAWTRDGAGDFDDRLPAYYVSALRFQKVDDTTNKSSVPAAAGAPKVNMATLVDATIYAEGGSWFIIPVPATVAANAGLGADQQIEWRRPAYAITVSGNITQMMTPSVTVDYDDEPDADGVATGAMKRWTDSLAYQVNDVAPSWQTLNYRAAPLPAFAVDATGAVVLDPSGSPVGAPIPQLPSSPDILYTYSN